VLNKPTQLYAMKHAHNYIGLHCKMVYQKHVAFHY